VMQFDDIIKMTHVIFDNL